jgi:hypothetical protein
MPLVLEKKYRLIVSRDGFSPAFIELKANANTCFQAIRQTVRLKPLQ